MTGNPTKTTHRTAMNLGADDYLAKPFTADDIIRCAENRLKRADVHWRVENKTLQDLRGALRSTLPRPHRPLNVVLCQLHLSAFACG